MVEEDGTSLILRLLRDIRGKLDEHDRRFDDHDRQFAILNKKIDDWQETTATALGLASHANIRSRSRLLRLRVGSKLWRRRNDRHRPGNQLRGA